MSALSEAFLSWLGLGLGLALTLTLTLILTLTLTREDVRFPTPYPSGEQIEVQLGEQDIASCQADEDGAGLLWLVVHLQPERLRELSNPHPHPIPNPNPSPNLPQAARAPWGPHRRRGARRDLDALTLTLTLTLTSTLTLTLTLTRVGVRVRG